MLRYQSVYVTKINSGCCFAALLASSSTSSFPDIPFPTWLGIHISWMLMPLWIISWKRCWSFLTIGWSERLSCKLFNVLNESDKIRYVLLFCSAIICRACSPTCHGSCWSLREVESVLVLVLLFLVVFLELYCGYEIYILNILWWVLFGVPLLRLLEVHSLKLFPGMGY